MSAFYANEFAADLPEGLLDRSVNVFSLRVDGPSDLSIVVTRDDLQPNEDLASYIDRQLATLQERLPQLRLRRREPAVISAQVGERIEITWQSPQGALTQRQIAVVTPRGLVMTFSATFRGTPSDVHASAFENFLVSVRLYDPKTNG
jgi:hypothetical protein